MEERRHPVPRAALAESASPLLTVDGVTVRFGGVVALKDVSFAVEEGTIAAIIGPNGAGKTTLFNCISGLYRPTGGRIGFAGAELAQTPPHAIAPLGIARTFQNVALFPALPVLENVMMGATARMPRGFLSAGLRSSRITRAERETRDEALQVLDRVGLAAVAGADVGSLPFGTLKRVELARALLARPRMLMLDEPANGLNHSEVDSLGGFVRKLRDDFSLTVLLVEHHMGMVMGISEKVIVLDFGQKIAEGSPAHVQRDPKVLEAYLGVEA